MTSISAACPCAWLRAPPIASWWRGNELDHLGADPDRRGLERRRAIAAQGGNPSAGAFLAVQRRHLGQQRDDPVQESALLGRHGVLWRQCLRMAPRPLQGAPVLPPPHAVLWV